MTDRVCFNFASLLFSLRHISLVIRNATNVTVGYVVVSILSIMTRLDSGDVERFDLPVRFEGQRIGKLKGTLKRVDAPVNSTFST